ncbi:unnamed protein product [Closterium sp. NIES-54]
MLVLLLPDSTLPSTSCCFLLSPPPPLPSISLPHSLPSRPLSVPLTTYLPVSLRPNLTFPHLLPSLPIPLSLLLPPPLPSGRSTREVNQECILRPSPPCYSHALVYVRPELLAPAVAVDAHVRVQTHRLAVTSLQWL